jgi:hypothetical protein
MRKYRTTLMASNADLASGNISLKYIVVSTVLDVSVGSRF